MLDLDFELQAQLEELARSQGVSVETVIEGLIAQNTCVRGVAKSHHGSFFQSVKLNSALPSPLDLSNYIRTGLVDDEHREIFAVFMSPYGPENAPVVIDSARIATPIPILPKEEPSTQATNEIANLGRERTFRLPTRGAASRGKFAGSKRTVDDFLSERKELGAL